MRRGGHLRLGDRSLPFDVSLDSRLSELPLPGQEEHPQIATEIVKADNPLPAIIGRTCHHPCETNCTLAQVGQPIAINFLKRWASTGPRGSSDRTGAERGNSR